jgi:hypothetical protein
MLGKIRGELLGVIDLIYLRLNGSSDIKKWIMIVKISTGFFTHFGFSFLAVFVGLEDFTILRPWGGNNAV